MKTELDTLEYYNELLDLYRPLLTEKQKEIGDKYFVYNLSMSEISEDLGITKTAVGDAINQLKKKLDNYEKRLNLRKKYADLNYFLENSDLTEEEKKAILGAIYGIWKSYWEI